MDIQFPNTISNPSYPLRVSNENTSITSKFEDGSMQSRRKFTRSRKTFALTWNSMPQNEFSILENFIVNVVYFSSNAFKWRNPVDNKTYNVRCTKFEEQELSYINFWRVSLEFTEV